PVHAPGRCRSDLEGPLRGCLAESYQPHCEVPRGCASQAASAASPTNQEGARESAELSTSSRAIPVKGPGALRGLCRSSAARSGLRHVELEPMGKAVR